MLKNDILTSIQVIDRKNDRKFIYVSNLAQNILSGFPNLPRNLKVGNLYDNVLIF